MLTFEFNFIKFSAQTELKGVIVFEPIILKEPVRTAVVLVEVTVEVAVAVVVAILVVVAVVVIVVPGLVVVVVLLQPARLRAATSTITRGKSHFLTECNNLYSPYY